MRKEKLFLVIIFILLIFTLSACKPNEEDNNDKSEKLRMLEGVKMNEHLDKINKIANFTVNLDVPIESNKFTFSSLISNDMILQANASVKLWGKFEDDGPIAVVIDNEIFYGEVVNNIFEIYVGPFSYGGPYEVIFITPSAKRVFKNVMFGEVFLMGGQSNMAITMKQITESASGAAKDAILKDIADSDNPNIRFVTVGLRGSNLEEEEYGYGQTFGWDRANPDTVRNISATAYYFVREMYKQYKVAIGFVNASVGATLTGTWIPIAEAEGMDQTYIKNISDADTASRYFNGMVYPTKNYTFRGVVWYQGEGQNIAYKENMIRLINGWRRVLDREELKFVIISLPRFDQDLPASQSSWFDVRKQQKELTNHPGVTYSVNIDKGIKSTYTTDAIHPYDKDELGARAAHAFMKAFYNAPGVLTSPNLIYAGLRDGKIILRFSNVGEGLYLNNPPAGFEVSADGNTYKPASASLNGKDEVIINSDVINPKFVRYGYAYVFPNLFPGNGEAPTLAELICIYNSAGYPADQFLIAIN